MSGKGKKGFPHIFKKADTNSKRTIDCLLKKMSIYSEYEKMAE